MSADYVVYSDGPDGCYRINDPHDVRTEDEQFLADVQSRFPRLVRIGKATGQVRLFGAAWDALRAFVWRREGFRCRDCSKQVILEKGEWDSVHCAHYKSKGSGGSDLPSNTRALCMVCHAEEHSGKRKVA